MIEIECQSCRRRLSVPDSLAGDFEACPSCRSLVAVPGPYKPELPASWKVRGRGAASRRPRRSLGLAIWSLTGVGFVLLCVGILGGLASRGPVAGSAYGLLAVIGGFCAALAIGLIPGAVARDRNLPNADGIMATGLLGLLFPVVWLVALVLAFVTAPPGHKAQG